MGGFHALSNNSKLSMAMKNNKKQSSTGVSYTRADVEQFLHRLSWFIVALTIFQSWNKVLDFFSAHVF